MRCHTSDPMQDNTIKLVKDTYTTVVVVVVVFVFVHTNNHFCPALRNAPGAL